MKRALAIACMLATSYLSLGWIWMQDPVASTSTPPAPSYWVDPYRDGTNLLMLLQWQHDTDAVILRDTGAHTSGPHNGSNYLGGATATTLHTNEFGVVRRFMQFDGVDDAVVVKHNAAMNAITAATWSIWIRPETNLERDVWTKTQTDVTSDWYVRYKPGSDIQLRLIFEGKGSLVCYTPTPIPQDQWTHCTWIWTGGTNTTSLTMKTNSVATGGTWKSGTFTSGSLIGSSNSICIGGRAPGVVHFKCSLSDPRWYTRALSASEVTNLYVNTSITNNIEEAFAAP